MRRILYLYFFAMPIASFAWGSTGHQVIATLAEKQLTPKAQAQINVLLAQEPGSTLASISTWADERRNPTTARWHFVSFPRQNCVYEAARDCPDGNCVVGAIQRQLEVLKSNADDDQKLQALKYLVHFVGDVHQPLHAGYADDRGGNQYQLQAFMRGTNLHAFWDSGLLKSVSDDPHVWVTRLVAKPLPGMAGIVDPVRIAEESCRIVAAPGFYPDRKVEAAYVERFTPVVEQQLQLAGARLARILNGVWERSSPSK